MQQIILLFILFFSTCNATYYSQCSQDRFINETFFKNKKKGIFVDIGAHNGISLSNTYFFESELKWNGICVEPIPEIFNQLQQNRRCICVQGCVTNRTGKGQLLKVCLPLEYAEMFSGLAETYAPQHIQRIQEAINIYGGSFELIDVDCYLLNDLLAKYKFKHIDLLSVDVEGSDFNIISSIDFDKYKIDVITVEDNYGDSRFIPFLESKGFTFVKKLEQDLVFVRQDFHFDKF